MSRLTARLPSLLLTLVAAMLCCCSLIKRSINMEHRLFVRVPGKVPSEAEKQCRLLTRSHHGWRFKHVIEAPDSKDGVQAQWYLAFRPDDDLDIPKAGSGEITPWSAVKRMAVEIAEASRETIGAYPQLIEPSLVFKDDYAWVDKPLEPSSPRSRGVPEVRLGELPAHEWPSVKKDGRYDPVWHLGEAYSQLAQAREAVRRQPGNEERRIRIGILDNGFDARHAAMPVQFEDEAAGDVLQELRPRYDICHDACAIGRTKPGESLGSHGTGAVGILAGRKVRFNDPRVSAGEVEIGAAPDARIIPVRVAPEMLSLSTANFALGIDYASRVQRCDVLSMSHGGSPSQMWADAVNAAYGRGTAMFAATGDYFAPHILPGLLNRLSMTGLLSLPPPSHTVYPAAFRRVVGVAGVTAAGKSYATTDWCRYLPNFWRVNPIFSLRGSYGADEVRRSLFDGWLCRERAKTDSSQVRRRNELRANPISAYAPAIPWLVTGKTHDTTRPDTIDIDGGGTSSATPQAAAAAAHWLAYHRKSIPASEWNTWKKAEAVYTAMIHSADRSHTRANAGKSPQDQIPDPFLGAGVLKARQMLQIDYQDAKAVRGETLSFPHTGHDKKEGRRYSEKDDRGMVPDYYDGERSFFSAVLTMNRGEDVPGFHRVLLREDRYSHALDQKTAMEQLFFNILLVDLWQHGRLPIQDGYKDKHPFRLFVSKLLAPLGKKTFESQIEHHAAKESGRAVAAWKQKQACFTP